MKHIIELETEIERLRAIVNILDTMADGTVIITEGPCYTPDGRLAYIEPFRETPLAHIKGDIPDADEWFDARTCFSTLKAAEAVGESE